MKRLLLVIVLAACMPAHAGNVNVTVNVGDPGFYGRIDIAGYPPPQLVYAQPVIVQPAPVAVAPEPLYLRVPPGHAKNWRKHCRKYNACAQQVYFVRDDWYNDVYVPRHAEKHGHGSHGNKHGKGKGKKEH